MTQNPQEDRYPIQVNVKTRYLNEQSSPEDGRYVFSYTITISNRGSQRARLVNRHWFITDADGKVEEVRGRGVVGEQPSIEPGGEYRYTSGAVLKTPVGSMEGSYGMVAEDGARFDARIPVFTLAVPHLIH
ncbi:MAG: Co2+/Mg2+ efflux protein ApaG [Gammaproteobacteria bacterium RIFOXYA12_FULL_61_12]|nr:MAG: Co2+/Mg2+ efflux protein ApaG [Gammaproteobacteria bacterium RIFOXYA12_FULL_61_12]OGT91719.1 MAG: Co2+/Mg2+ efflux protein ApaG [Gammaproteobacteria bacterium RIFOXYD12_FULL_61_37]